MEEIQMDEVMGETGDTGDQDFERSEGEKEDINPNALKVLNSKDGELVQRDTNEKQINKQEDGRRVLSYKDKLMGFNGDIQEGSDKNHMHDLEVGEKDESYTQEEETEKEDEDSAYPIVRVSLKERKELSKPWKKALIVKLSMKRLGICFLKARLHKL